MQFRQGMLGVAVVAVALATAILGSWVMSLDVEERQVTRFNELMEITTLFDSDLVPTFTDYNPSDNYVGYFTDATTIDGVRYFGGVDYGEAARANNFKLNLPPIERSAGNLTLLPDGTFDHYTVSLYMGEDNRTRYVRSSSIEASYLRDIIAQVTTQTEGVFTMRSVDDIDFNYRSGNIDLNCVWFTNESDWDGLLKSYNAATRGYMENGGKSQYAKPIYLSATADLSRGIVTLYTDNQYRDRALDISIDSCVVVYGGGDPSPITNNNLKLSKTAPYVFELFPPNTYLDPSKGVELE